MNGGGKQKLATLSNKQRILDLYTSPVLILMDKVFRDLVREVKQSYPEETCGVMGGFIKGDEIVVSCVNKLSNTSVEKGKFWFNELDWIHKVALLISHGLEYIGLYHSHPSPTLAPSPSDLERMVECPGEIWLILSYTPVSKLLMGAWTIPNFSSGLLRIPVIVKRE